MNKFLIVFFKDPFFGENFVFGACPRTSQEKY